MHFFAYEDRSLQYRRKSENLFRIINKAIWAVQLACTLVGIILLVIAAEDMFTESPMGAGATISLNARYQAIFDNCTTTTITDTFLLKSVPFTVDSGNVQFLLALYASRVTQAIVVAALAVIISLVNKTIYDFNLFFWNKNFLIIRKDIISTIDFIFVCASIAANALAHEFAEPLRQHVETCGQGEVLSAGSKNYLAATNFIPFYLAACLPLAVHVVTFCLLFYNTIIVDTVDAPPTEEEAEEGHVGDEPLPDGQQQKPPEELATIMQEQKILKRQKEMRDGTYNPQQQQGSSDSVAAITNTKNTPNTAAANANNADGTVDSPSRRSSQQIVPFDTNQQSQQQQSQQQQQHRPGAIGFGALRALTAMKHAAASHHHPPHQQQQYSQNQQQQQQQHGFPSPTTDGDGFDPGSGTTPTAANI